MQLSKKHSVYKMDITLQNEKWGIIFKYHGKNNGLIKTKLFKKAANIIRDIENIYPNTF